MERSIRCLSGVLVTLGFVLQPPGLAVAQKPSTPGLGKVAIVGLNGLMCCGRARTLQPFSDGSPKDDLASALLSQAEALKTLPDSPSTPFLSELCSVQDSNARLIKQLGCSVSGTLGINTLIILKSHTSGDSSAVSLKLQCLVVRVSDARVLWDKSEEAFRVAWLASQRQAIDAEVVRATWREHLPTLARRLAEEFDKRFR
jgi:hypothetical protein